MKDNTLFILQTTELSKKGDKFHIDFSVDIPKLELDKNGIIVLTPILKKNEYSRELPNILINGEERHKGYVQMVHHIGEEAVHSTLKIYKAFKARSYCNRVCYYELKIVYEDWMNGAEIWIKGIEEVPNGRLFIA